MGALTLLQTVAAGLAYAGTGVRRLGARPWAVLALSAVLVAFPSVGSFTVCVWNDVPYVVAHLYALGTLARIVDRTQARADVAGGLANGRGNADDRDNADGRRNGAAAVGWPLLALLGAELTVVALMRSNGFVVVAMAVVLAAAVLRGGRIRLITVGVAAAGVAIAANGLLFPALGVEDVSASGSAGVVYGDIAVVYAAHPDASDPSDVAVLESIAPLAGWRRGANCRTIDPLAYAPGFDQTPFHPAAGPVDRVAGALWSCPQRGGTPWAS